MSERLSVRLTKAQIDRLGQLVREETERLDRMAASLGDEALRSEKVALGEIDTELWRGRYNWNDQDRPIEGIG